MEPVISLQDISVRQGEHFCLSIPKLELQPRRIYVLTGSNGAGKSTLLRIMAILTSPQMGRVEFAADGSSKNIEMRRRVTLVEQSPYLLAGTVYDNLSFGLRLRGIRGEEQRVRIAEALELVGLEGFEQRKASNLSGGEVQRVALARALVLQPKVLLLDEPTANIDNRILQIFETIIRKLPERGVTVVLTTHDMFLAERLGGELLRLENGSLHEKIQLSSGLTRVKESDVWPQLSNAQGL